MLAERARRFADVVQRAGASTALTTVDPAINQTPAGVSIAKLQNARHDVGRRGLLVAPSGFIRPHLYLAVVPGRPLLLIHPVDAGPPVPPVNELLARLATVAKRGRLEVARAIATEPRTIPHSDEPVQEEIGWQLPAGPHATLVESTGP